jgi:hypothetical protein
MAHHHRYSGIALPAKHTCMQDQLTINTQT